MEVRNKVWGDRKLGLDIRIENSGLGLGLAIGIGNWDWKLRLEIGIEEFYRGLGLGPPPQKKG